MPVKIMDQGSFTWNSVNLTAFVASMALVESREEREVTAWSTGFRKMEAGLRSTSLEIEFRQTEDAAQVMATLYPDYVSNTERPWTARQDSGAISATNPDYTGTGKIVGIQPLVGTVGEIVVNRVTITVTSLTVRDTTP